MIADAQPDGSKQENSNRAKRDASPAEEPRNERQQREQMDEKKEEPISPIDHRQLQRHP
jgi:hypothetical protein